MVDLDSICESVPDSLSEDFTYNVIDECLFQNLLVFALRKSYVRGAEAIYGVFGQTYRSPPLARWCLAATKVLNAITSMENNVGSENDLTPSTEEQRVRLGYLLDVAVELFEQLNTSSPYHNALNGFIEKARRVLIHMHLEQFSVTKNYEVLLNQLNLHFPGLSTDSTVRAYRLTISKLLLSPSRIQRYLRERWIPNRINAIESLQSCVSELAQNFPEVLLDYINTAFWAEVDEILLRLNTGLAFAMRELFHDRTECTENDLVQLARNGNTQSLPSQMF